MDVFLPSPWGPALGLPSKHRLLPPTVPLEGGANSRRGLLKGSVAEQENSVPLSQFAEQHRFSSIFFSVI